ncbi:MAG: hypothetical protein M3A44_15055 [Gammaproteobacteria bacterium]
MSLSDLHNPKAAAEMIDRFRKRFSSKVCMAPHADHEGSIISAHTLSVEAMLRKIAVDSHVYSAGQAKRIARDTFPIEIQRRGLRDVSVFNGFCQKHDRELFACLETEPFRFGRQQIFMLAYRGAARECYLKRKQYETLPSPDDYADIHGIEEKLRLSEAALIFQAASLRGAEEAEGLKASLDSHLMNQAWGRLITRAILFPKSPSVLATAAFQPFFDMNGVQLQDFEDLEAEMSQICMSVIPVETGAAAVFSWLDSANSAPSRFFDSVAAGSNLTSAVLHAVLDNTENFALNPTWYEGLPEDKKRYIFSRMMLFEQSVSYSDRKRPDETAPVLDEWGHGVIASF